jgi:PEP-CTERM motif
LVPVGYTSGASLSDTATYAGQTFASIGAIPGTYVWTWGTGVHADSFTVNIKAAAVPEPASIALLGTALAGLLLAGAVRRQ